MLTLPELKDRMSGSQGKLLLKSFMAALVMTSIFYSSGASADIASDVTSSLTTSIPNLQTMLTNFATAVPALTRLVTASAYVLGMFFCIAAIAGMKHFGEMRTMMAREHGMMGPIIELLIGAALIYLPSSVQTFMSTFWTTTNPYAYILADTGSTAAFENVCYAVVQLIGVIAFIRGLLILQQASGERAQPHMIGKALSHLFGGVLCINIYNTLQALQTTVGWL